MAFQFQRNLNFLYADTEKIINPQSFAIDIYNYRLLPDFAVNLLAIILPWIEVFVAVSLISGFFSRGSALIATLLFFTFTVALTVNLIRGLDVSCGCFGSSDDKINWLYLFRDLSLMAISIFILLYDRGKRNLLKQH